jgi:hypothetical protein
VLFQDLRHKVIPATKVNHLCECIASSTAGLVVSRWQRQQLIERKVLQQQLLHAIAVPGISWHGSKVIAELPAS